MTQKPLKSPIKVTKYRKPWEVGTSMEPQRPAALQEWQSGLFPKNSTFIGVLLRCVNTLYHPIVTIMVRYYIRKS